MKRQIPKNVRIKMQCIGGPADGMFIKAGFRGIDIPVQIVGPGQPGWQAHHYAVETVNLKYVLKHKGVKYSG